MDLTDGVGVDVALEMAGFNDSVNNAVRITRRGGKVVLFGVRNGNATLEDAHRVVMNGLSLHAVIGRVEKCFNDVVLGASFPGLSTGNVAIVHYPFVVSQG